MVGRNDPDKIQQVGRLAASLHPGREGELHTAGGIVLCAPTREDMAELARVGAEVEGLARLMMEGRVWALPCGTRCRVVERPLIDPLGGDAFLVVVGVEIVGGDHDGARCWVGAEFVR